eukprot:TRINITY_DN9405_c0_g1_i3.p1 TRINITY_DN9405_c0_g1~~TRINITY_DN9405_c0_g1_i3.p1  ORF type:complete len:895 (-),score=21.18 TRINITY_DN9405_c0_g1_i3:64-2748(-)
MWANRLIYVGYCALALISNCVLARVVINEVSPAGTLHGPCEGLEFFELLNLGDSAVSLSKPLLTVELAVPCDSLWYTSFWDRGADAYLQFFYPSYESAVCDPFASWDYWEWQWDTDPECGISNAYWQADDVDADGNFSINYADENTDYHPGCLMPQEVPYYSFEDMHSDGLLLKPGERHVKCVPSDVTSVTFFVPLLWYALQSGWPRTIRLYERFHTASQGWHARLVDQTGRLHSLPSTRFQFQSPVETCREVMSNLTFTQLCEDLAGLAWARVPDGGGLVEVVGRATPGETNTKCLMGEPCADCPPPSRYRQKDRRCICPPGTRLSSTQPFKCAACEQGRFSRQIDLRACDPCPAGWGAGRGDSSCELCPLHTFSPGGTACRPCPGGLVTQSEGTRNISECICAKGRFLVAEGQCETCSWPYTSRAAGAASAEDCVVDLWTIMPYLLGLCALAIIAILFAAYLRLRKYIKDQNDSKMHDDLAQGLASIYSPQYPLCLIAMVDFCNLTQEDLSFCHEGARDAGQLLCLDSKKSIDGFKSLGNRILFFSYTWTSWEKLGPNSVQAACMKAAAERICSENHMNPEHFFVWLDILGIPQANNCCKALAVHSLYVYAASADFLVVICPPCFHEQTGDVVDVTTYKSRVWCRVEQMAHCLSHGMETMYVSFEKGQLEKVTDRWISDALHIFEGEVTCCRLRHPHEKVCDKKLLVPTVLAMYTDMLARVGADGSVQGPADLQIVWDMICKGRSRIFPRHFDYVHDSGKRSSQMLFGQTIEWAHELAKHEQLAVVAAAREGDVSAKDSVTTVDVESPFKFAGQAMSQHLRQVHGGASAKQMSSRGGNAQPFAAQSQQQLRRKATTDLPRGNSRVVCTAMPESNCTAVRDGEPARTHAAYSL